ncbi:hypothetical protein [Methylotetracoccus oryzae]|uniref:hypothetical protein n=1 Tax=Methylotetracoccus oryzae TaxID=1919059 RepID=UPI00111837D4|nr:hypothetical protein [Methylotetracoccus oryzae]
MNVMTRALGCLALAFALEACTGEPVKIDSISDVSQVDLTKGRKISAEAGGFQFYWVFPINVNSRLKRAYQELLEKAGYDAIADVKVTEKWAYGYVGTTYWTIMEATAYPRKRPLAAR